VASKEPDWAYVKAIKVKSFNAGLESMRKVNPSSETLLE